MCLHSARSDPIPRSLKQVNSSSAVSDLVFFLLVLLPQRLSRHYPPSSGAQGQRNWGTSADLFSAAVLGLQSLFGRLWWASALLVCLVPQKAAATYASSHMQCAERLCSDISVHPPSVPLLFFFSLSFSIYIYIYISLSLPLSLSPYLFLYIYIYIYIFVYFSLSPPQVLIFVSVLPLYVNLNLNLYFYLYI